MLMVKFKTMALPLLSYILPDVLKLSSTDFLGEKFLDYRDCSSQMIRHVCSLCASKGLNSPIFCQRNIFCECWFFRVIFRLFCQNNCCPDYRAGIAKDKKSNYMTKLLFKVFPDETVRLFTVVVLDVFTRGHFKQPIPLHFWFGIS